jgi:hypothetical protein
MKEIRDQLLPKGRVEIFVTRGRPALVLGAPIANVGNLPLYSSCEIDLSSVELLEKQDLHNIVVNIGKDKVITSLVSGSMNVVARMVMGDRGTIPSDSTVPKSPTSGMEALYNNVYRADLDAVILNVGSATVHEAKFIRTFSAVDVPITAFSNQANPVINEVGLVTADLISVPLPRAPVASPDLPLADEKLFSIRTFKSVPFEAANEIAVTIRYTIYIE